MELFIFTVFQLLMEVQSYKAPAVKVSPDALRESSSVKMICETPADVPVKQCHFYTNREQKNIKVNPSCELDLTGAEVLRWADVKSPASVHINCFYTTHELGIDKPSPHSPADTVTVLGLLQKPIISVSNDDDSINISCEIPLSVRADFNCSLYTEDGLLHRSVSQNERSQSGELLCIFYSSHSELFTQSVNSRQLSCDYSLNTEREIRSPRSDTHTIRDLPQAKLTASASVILETDTVQLICENTKHLKMEEMCLFYINGRESNSKLSLSCQISLTGSQISIWSGGSSGRITCFYTVKKSQGQKQSPFSDPVTITIKLSTPDVHDTTAMKTSDQYSKSNLPTSTSDETMFSMATSTLPVNRRMSLISEPSTWMPISTSTPNTVPRMDTKTAVMTAVSTTETPTLNRMGLFIIMLVSSGVGVILSGLICLWFACQKRRRCNKMRSVTSDVPSQGISVSSGPAETYCLTSVPATSQPISGGVLVNKQQKEENTEENEVVYHLYCTIPDKPVHSNAEDPVYSLVD